MTVELLDAAVGALGQTTEELVFVGGTTIGLWIDDPAAPPPRITDDVDAICDVATLAEYYALGERLRQRGFAEVMNDPVICRWRHAATRITVDVVPIAEDILGFGNPWYRDGVAHASTCVLPSGTEVRALSPPFLVASKLSAWEGRGRNDLLRSVDVGDVLQLVNGRQALHSEIAAAEASLRIYVGSTLADLSARDDFDYALEDATRSYGAASQRRQALLRDRIAALVAVGA